MPVKKFTTVSDYMDAQPEESRAKLKQLRKAIRQAAPQAEETISYNIPAFRWNGAILVWCAAFKTHSGFYPKASTIAAFKKELSAYKTSKGAIQFPTGKPIPVALVKRMVKFRIREEQKRR